MATGRVSAVFLDGETLIGWCRSGQAFGSAKEARQVAESWVAGFAPDHLIVADTASLTHKGAQSRTITEAIADCFATAHGLHLRVRRVQKYANKYEEAEALAKRFPPAQALLSKRPPIWLPEPRNMGYFEALALVQTVIDPPDDRSKSTD